MTRCIIHIGMHKTGSTSIQESLRGFSDDKFLYPVLGNAANHSLAIFSLFGTHGGRHHLHRANGRDAAAVRAYNRAVEADLEKAIEESRGRTLLISGEDISVLPRHDLEKLRDYFQARVDAVEIVGYVRSPAGFIASGFQERVKGGLEEWAGPEQIYRSYRDSFGRFDEVFGRENVRLWKFDPKAFPGGCAVQDFCSRLGIELPAERILRLNESLSRQAVALLYIYRKFGRKLGATTLLGAESQSLGKALSVLGEDKFRFSPDVIRPVLEKYRSDIEWMEARLGQSLHEELGEHRPGDVRGESDLIEVDPSTVAGLLALLGEDAPEGVKGETPEEVARLVHALRVKHNPGGERRGQALRVDAADLIRQLQRAGRLQGVPAGQAEALLRSAFGCIRNSLAEGENAVVSCPGLGQFRVKRASEGSKQAAASKVRIDFFRAVPGAIRRAQAGRGANTGDDDE